MQSAPASSTTGNPARRAGDPLIRNDLPVLGRWVNVEEGRCCLVVSMNLFLSLPSLVELRTVGQGIRTRAGSIDQIPVPAVHEPACGLIRCSSVNDRGVPVDQWRGGDRHFPDLLW